MKMIYTPHYARFQCIADRCPDSCCQAWLIVVDAESAAQYRNVPGKLGDRLRAAMQVDEDGEIIFQQNNDRCPFWNDRHLCDIQAQLGEEALCETCACFPRLMQDYGDFVECDLSPACPEATRLLLTLPLESWTLVEEVHPEWSGDPPAYDPVRMAQLRQQREVLFAKLQDTTRPAVQQLAQCLEQALVWEHMPMPKVEVCCTSARCLQFLKSLEILSNHWMQWLEQAEAAENPIFYIDASLDKEIRLFTIDTLYRYYLRAAFDSTAVPPVQMAALLICAALTMIKRLRLNSTSERMTLWQRLVKEVECDIENFKRLIAHFQMHRHFSPVGLYNRLMMEKTAQNNKGNTN